MLLTSVNAKTQENFIYKSKFRIFLNRDCTGLVLYSQLSKAFEFV